MRSLSTLLNRSDWAGGDRRRRPETTDIHLSDHLIQTDLE